MTNTYFRIPHKAEAIRVSESNLEEVANWCGGEVISGNTAVGIMSFFGVRKSDTCVAVPTKNGYIDVAPGDWLVREKRDGIFFRLDHESFIQLYQVKWRAMSDDAFLATCDIQD